MIKIENLSKNWGSFSLKNVSLSVDDSEYLVLLGPTGSGKTLLLETIMGYNTPDEGRIIIDGNDVTGISPEKRGIGYVPQNSVLFPHMSVRQNIIFGLKMQRMEKSKQEKTVDEIVDLLNIKPIEHRQPANLSGGEKQKVALARVLALNSRLVLLDEPLSSVDSETARQLREEIKKLHSEGGKTIIHVTHSLIEGFGLADKIALMKDGRIEQVDKAQEILDRPRNEFAARLLGYENVYKAEFVRVEKGYAILNLNGIEFKASSEINRATLVALRSEDIFVELVAVNERGVNILEANIVEISDLGPLVMLKADAGFLVTVAIAKNTFFEKRIEQGKKVWLKFNVSALRTIQ